MRATIFCFVLVPVMFSSNAFAGLCENAVRTNERKAGLTKTRCENNRAVDRLKLRLSSSTDEKAKAKTQASIDKAIAKQQTHCVKLPALNATTAKLKSFCAIAASASTSYCTRGYAIRVKDGEAWSRCRRGRLWFPDKGEAGRCYFVDEFFYTSEGQFGQGKATSAGEILYSDRPAGTSFYQINTGFLVPEAKSSNDCS